MEGFRLVDRSEIIDTIDILASDIFKAIIISFFKIITHPNIAIGIMKENLI